MPSRLVVGMSGASGAVYGVRLLETLRRLGVETHLVITQAAALTLAHETDLRVDDVRALANHVHPIRALDAPIASGSFPTDGMIVAPCSVRCLSAIATGVTSDLLTRAADVTLKERRRLVLVVRETPLHAGHLHAMSRVTELGAIVAPPLPAFYARPKSVDELVDHSVGRVLDLFGLESGGVRRWGASAGEPPPRPRRGE
jgi:4-hydroxy-3-polyprenylbenzoate decarboxylase